jgi:hypothetical protein
MAGRGRGKSGSAVSQYIPLMKLLLIIIGALLILIGGLWVLQGTYVLTQGAMAGDMKWTIIGGILAVVGIVLLLTGVLKKKAVRTT